MLPAVSPKPCALPGQTLPRSESEFGTADPGIRLQLTEEGCGEYDALDANSAERLRKGPAADAMGVQP